ncbi:MAG TPA: thiol peroxidase [bacterium]
MTPLAGTQLEERKGVVTFKGSPLTLLGPALKPGQPAPDFRVLGQDLSEVMMAEFQGRPLLISVVPSLDTAVCDQQTRRFNEAAAQLDGVAVLTVSMDLPFAQKRWCGAAGIDRIRVVSDHREATFGAAYGVLVKELRLLTRSVFVIDARGAITHVEIVPEMTTHPDYDAAIAAAKKAAGGA